ncbi:Oidioi.mRNA.OKI2018_I69.chr1.g1619.t1.cds [Oikopleura dioica]|uniref:Oidioi.mRNA.OKI2018_I69.chr1.g1619.t1.cds n=1 Tax=Oikopleura dioica TaxID=34765 RepID=A0ABN7SSQ2_OIKDI|nr:Oidioi.mRNA.OKI2018_I69.chr1.g1619.t1.cds [Oikopleura dioica]
MPIVKLRFTSDVDTTRTGFQFQVNSLINEPGYQCFNCDCLDGLMKVGYICEEILECEDEINPVCGTNSICKDVFTSFECSCGAGFIPATCQGYQGCANFECIDVDECVHDPCVENAICENTIGSYTCECIDGLVMIEDICEEIFECEEKIDPVCGKNSICKDIFASFECTCAAGFLEDTCQGHENCATFTCFDDDECTADPCAENMHCNNTLGSFDCFCFEGMEEIGGTCVDIDECSAIINPCRSHSACKNTHRSYECHCNAGFSGGFAGDQAIAWTSNAMISMNALLEIICAMSSAQTLLGTTVVLAMLPCVKWGCLTARL